MKKVGWFILGIGLLLIVIGISMNFMQASDKDDMAVVLFKDDTGKIIYEKNVKIGEKLLEIQPNEREGYTFVGWFYDSVIYDFDSKVLKDFTLIGKWEVTLEQGNQFVVTFYNDDHTLYESQTVKPNGQVQNPPTPVSEEGGKFIGWYNGDLLFDFEAKVTSNITLYARYEKNTSDPKKTPDSGTDLDTDQDPSGVELHPDEESIIQETGIECDIESIEIVVGGIQEVVASIVPSNATRQNIKMYCENSETCSVSQEGIVVGENVGSTNVVLETFRGIKKLIPIKVVAMQ